MSLMNYGNLGKQAKEAKANSGFRPLVEDTFPCVFKDGKLTETSGIDFKTKQPKPKKDMFMNIWSIRRKADEFMHKRDLKVRTILTVDFQVDRFLTNMIDLGVDLDKVGAAAEAMPEGDEHKVWNDVFEDLEEYRVKANVEVSYKDADKDADGKVKDRAFPEIRVKDIIQGLPADSDWAIEGGWVAEDTDDSAKEAAPAPKEEPKEEPEPEPEPVKEEAPVEEPKEEAPKKEDDWD